MEFAVSVVIPAFNAEDFIGETLESVKAQEYQADEIIVVNDGSADRTLGVVENFERTSGVPVRIVSQPNSGASAARNVGVRTANSEWIAFIEADDTWNEKHLGAAEGLLKQYGDVADALFTDSVVFGGQGIIKKSYSADRPKAIGEPISGGAFMLDHGLYESLLNGNYLSMSNFVVRREAVARAGWFDESVRVANDRDFLLRLSKVTRFLFSPIVTGAQRVHDQNLTGVSMATRGQYVIRFLDKLSRAHREYGLTEAELRATKHAYRLAVRRYLYGASQDGLGALACAYQAIYERSIPLCAGNPKHAIRALYRSLAR